MDMEGSGEDRIHTDEQTITDREESEEKSSDWEEPGVSLKLNG